MKISKTGSLADVKKAIKLAEQALSNFREIEISLKNKVDITGLSCNSIAVFNKETKALERAVASRIEKLNDKATRKLVELLVESRGKKAHRRSGQNYFTFNEIVDELVLGATKAIYEFEVRAEK